MVNVHSEETQCRHMDYSFQLAARVYKLGSTKKKKMITSWGVGWGLGVWGGGGLGGREGCYGPDFVNFVVN